MNKMLSLELKPDWNEIERIRNDSGLFLKAHGLSPDGVSAVTMVISELVENAIKYGTFPGAEDSISLDIDVEKGTVIVQVKNPIDESRIPYLRHLDETIQWIRGYQDPFETYIIKLRQISSKPLQDTESGLGLVRISYEGQSILDFYVSENRVLNVSAVYKY